MEQNRWPEWVKIRINLPDAEDGLTGESFWCVQVGENLYEVRNILWMTLEINFGDIIRAVADDPESKPEFVEVVHRRGHRTLHVIFSENWTDQKQTVIDRVKELGGGWENMDNWFYAIDLKPEADFDDVAEYLVECEDSGWLSVEYGPQPHPKGTGDLIN